MQPIIKGNSAIVWGTLTKDADYKSGEKNGKHWELVSFSLQYDYDTSTKKSKYISCTAFGRVATRFACNLEKGDIVLVCGRLEEDEYRTKKDGKQTFKINAELIFAQTLFDAVTSDFAQQEYSNTDYAENDSQSEPDGFADISDEQAADLPF